MKKPIALTVCSLFALSAVLFAVGSKTYEGSGEVLEVEPLYSRVTIKHGKIKGLTGGPESDFFVSSADILKNIQKRDLVDFTLQEEKGDVKLVKITKTGEALPKRERSELGDAVQGALESTSQLAQGVTAPIPQAQEVVKGTLGATTDTTGAVFEATDGGTEVKREF